MHRQFEIVQNVKTKETKEQKLEMEMEMTFFFITIFRIYEWVCRQVGFVK